MTQQEDKSMGCCPFVEHLLSIAVTWEYLFGHLAGK
jgi:hypothetical protein